MLEGLFQPMHMLIILAIALLIFGPGKLPQIGAGLGKGIREFKKALSGEEKDLSTECKTATTNDNTKDAKDKG